MPVDGKQRKKKASRFDFVIIPVEDASSPKKLRISRITLWLLGVAGVIVSGLVVVLVLIYTPLGAYVPIPNPALERKYGRQIIETQERLTALAGQVSVLGDYNAQLRKALGEGGQRDTLSATRVPRQKVAGPERRDVPSSMDAFQSENPARAIVPPAQIVAMTASFRGTFPLLAPTQGVVTQNFDAMRNHFGMDFAAKSGTPVYAATQGYVVFAGWTYEDGNVLIIAHGGGYATVYKHAQALLKTRNSFVKRGELIALLGNTGQTSQGPHLHFEVLKDGIPHDPNEFLLTTAKL